MFDPIREKLYEFFTSRIFLLMLVSVIIAGVLIHRVFELQIVNGEDYAVSFETKIKKERTIPGSRGCIYDRNGNLLAYNELAHSITIEDVLENGKMKNYNLNQLISTLIDIVEENGDSTIYDFKISLDSYNRYVYTVEDTQLLRFIADVYGKRNITELTEEQKKSSAEDIINYLCGWDRFRIGEYTAEDNSETFEVGKGLSKEKILKILTIRYDMNNNSFQKYIATTVAADVCEETVAMVMENNDILKGVSIVDDTIRKYVDGVYFSNILGYTGKVSPEELEELLLNDNSYDMNDTVGKLGIEKSMEEYLQGTKGYETLYVNSVGKVTETLNYVDPIAGNDIYLTIDKDLQIACYKIIEEQLASILYTNIINAKDFDASAVSSSKIKIPIYDVYFALIDNNVIDINRFSRSDAKETENSTYLKYEDYKAKTFEKLYQQLYASKTPYEDLKLEYQVYESYIVEMLYSGNIIQKSLIDSEDSTYIAWTKDEVISLAEYIEYCISKGWVDVKKLDINSQYSDSSAIYDAISDYIFTELDNDLNFTKKMYKYMLKSDVITGNTICKLLLEQNIVDIEESEEKRFLSGQITAYGFMMNRIKNIDITPAQLALDPHSASVVITDVNNGDVLALVSYPGYDNNKMANGVNTDYFNKLLNDHSTPLINYATRQMTAPGSTFKMVSATAGLMEGTITTSTRLTCTGLFDKIEPPAKCWIYGQGSHGSIPVSDAIRHSCNMFFYELAYELGTVDGIFSNDIGLSTLEKYASLYGLNDLSGIEIEESVPTVSTEDAVRSAIGQGNNNYSTVGLARYVTTVANSGTCYNLTLVDKITDKSGFVLKDNQAEVRNTIDMNDSYWKAIHKGMREVVLSKAYYSDLGVNVAGKTGTAEENKNRANHALFVCYAPYENPEMALALRIANGYSSTYAAQTAKEVLKYYFNLAEEEDVITGTASALTVSTEVTD